MKLIVVFPVLIFLVWGITGLNGDRDNDKDGAALSDTASVQDKPKKSRGHEDAASGEAEKQGGNEEEPESGKPKKRMHPASAPARRRSDDEEEGPENEGENDEKRSKPKRHRKHKKHHDDEENEPEGESEEARPKKHRPSHRKHFKFPALRPDDSFSTTYQKSYDKGAEKFSMSKNAHKKKRHDDD